MSVLNSYLEKVAADVPPRSAAQVTYRNSKMNTRIPGVAKARQRNAQVDAMGPEFARRKVKINRPDSGILSNAMNYVKNNPYKSGAGALALAGGLYGAKKLKDSLSEKKASLEDAYELGFYDAIEKVAKKEEESRGSRYSRFGGGLALPIGGIYGGGRLAEHLATTHGGKITNETLRKALPHAKNIGRGLGGAAGLAAAYGLNKALEKKSAYEEVALDKVAMWMDAGY